MNKQRKYWDFSQLNSIYNDNNTILIVHYNNMNMSDWVSLKRNLMDFEVNTRVVKNNLMYLIFDKLDYNEIKNVFAGPTAIIYGNCEDVNFKNIIKVINAHSKLVLLAGKFKVDSLNYMELDKIQNLPTLFELQCKLVNDLKMNQANLINLLMNNQSNLVKILQHK